MAVLVHFSPTSLTPGQYQAILDALDSAGVHREGMLFHACYGSGDHLRVVDLWSSSESFAAFAAKLEPLLASLGVQLSGPPEVFPVHNLQQAARV